jgi:hypothetical protein
MLTDSKLRAQVDLLWDKLWSGGLANPLDAIEQISLYSKLRTSPLDTGLERGYTCSLQLLNAPGKVSGLHPARPIEKARTSLAWFLSQTDHERVALRAPQYKGT